MTCPRCGFQTYQEPCTLCGQKDFNDFELSRFSGESPPRLEFTLIAPVKHLDPSHPVFSNRSIRSAITDEFKPRLFLFFPDDQSEALFEFLRQLTNLKDWSMMINGRLRPFSQELWLPLLEMSKLS